MGKRATIKPAATMPRPLEIINDVQMMSDAMGAAREALQPLLETGHASYDAANEADQAIDRGIGTAHELYTRLREADAARVSAAQPTGLYSATASVGDDINLLRLQFEALLNVTTDAIVEIDAGDDAPTSDAVDTLHAMTRAMRAELATMRDLATRLEPVRTHLHAVEYGARA